MYILRGGMTSQRSGVRKFIGDLFLGRSVHRDDVIADGVEAAIIAGEVLATGVRKELESTAPYVNLDTSLSVIDGGSGNEKPGSLLVASCTGAVAAVGLRELRLSKFARSHDDVLFDMVCRSIAAWEVGREDIGRTPNPWSGTTHLLYPPGTLAGGKVSVAQKVIFFSNISSRYSKAENAKILAQTIVSIVRFPGLLENYYNLRQLSMDETRHDLPASAVNAVTARVLGIDSFWPAYTEGKRIVW
jgi:hypothetical protein